MQPKSVKNTHILLKSSSEKFNQQCYSIKGIHQNIFLNPDYLQKKSLPEYDIEHHQTQPSGDPVQLLFRD